MKAQDWEKLAVGDTVRQRTGCDGYVITECLGHGRYVAVRTIFVTNSQEWELSCKRNVETHE